MGIDVQQLQDEDEDKSKLYAYIARNKYICPTNDIIIIKSHSSHEDFKLYYPAYRASPSPPKDTIFHSIKITDGPVHFEACIRVKNRTNRIIRETGLR